MDSKNKKRVLIKISGESLMGNRQFGQDPFTLVKICKELKSIKDSGYEVCLVVGGGNICRGAEVEKIGIERATADYMGMLATIMNAIALQSTLENMDVITRVQSAISMPSICETYIRRKAIRHMQKGRVIVFAAGTGNPYFTTDTGAALKAVEMHCDYMVKATKVDGVYDKDPNKYDDARKYHELNYQTIIEKNLDAMDTSAITLARDNNIPILVLNIHKKGSLMSAIKGEGNDFTIIKDEKK